MSRLPSELDRFHNRIKKAPARAGNKGIGFVGDAQRDGECDMIATVWTNGNTELGLKISAKDRDQFFKKEWSYVILELEGVPYPVDVEVSKPSFWRWPYAQLVNRDLGDWLTANGLSHWPPRKPPKLTLEPMGNRRFRLHRRTNIVPE